MSIRFFIRLSGIRSIRTAPSAQVRAPNSNRYFYSFLIDWLWQVMANRVWVGRTVCESTKWIDVVPWNRKPATSSRSSATVRTIRRRRRRQPRRLRRWRRRFRLHLSCPTCRTTTLNSCWPTRGCTRRCSTRSSTANASTTTIRHRSRNRPTTWASNQSPDRIIRPISRIMSCRCPVISLVPTTSARQQRRPLPRATFHRPPLRRRRRRRKTTRGKRRRSITNAQKSGGPIDSSNHIILPNKSQSSWWSFV